MTAEDRGWAAEVGFVVGLFLMLAGIGATEDHAAARWMAVLAGAVLAAPGWYMAWRVSR